MSRREKIIIFAVAAVCLVCSVIFVFIPKKSGSYAVISLDGETVMKKYNIQSNEKLKDRIHQERIAYLKQFYDNEKNTNLR